MHFCLIHARKVGVRRCPATDSQNNNNKVGFLPTCYFENSFGIGELIQRNREALRLGTVSWSPQQNL